MNQKNISHLLPFLLLLAVLWHSRLCWGSLPARELFLVERPSHTAVKEITS